MRLNSNVALCVQLQMDASMEICLQTSPIFQMHFYVSKDDLEFRYNECPSSFWAGEMQQHAGWAVINQIEIIPTSYFCTWRTNCRLDFYYGQQNGDQWHQSFQVLYWIHPSFYMRSIESSFQFTPALGNVDDFAGLIVLIQRLGAKKTCCENLRLPWERPWKELLNESPH